ncbi:MAG: tRNA 4-thiouridine(8) synthase ThiI [Candidatus Fermentibacterota bacterium]
MGVGAVGAFSGGLDSVLAAWLLSRQGLELELVTFHSPFFPATEAAGMAKQFTRARWRVVDFTPHIMEIIRCPASGFGGNMNPCIDCHARMFMLLGETASKEGLDLVFTGEVLGQRPMSQNSGSLRRVERLAGLPGRILRPLSAKLLPETEAERRGLVDREGLLDISGRGRKRQLAIAGREGLLYRPPAGGCLLTDPGYSRRLRLLLEMGLLDASTAGLIRSGRMMLIPGGLCLVGRSHGDNLALESAAGEMETFRMADRPGPLAVALGPEPDLRVMASAMALYAKVPPGKRTSVIGSRATSLQDVAPMDRREADRLLVH